MPHFFINIKEFTSEDTNIYLSLYCACSRCLINVLNYDRLKTPDVDASNPKMQTIDKCQRNFTTNIIFCILNINDIRFKENWYHG